MCARYLFSEDTSDIKIKAVMDTMEEKYPDQYRTGDIYPGIAAPAIILNNGKVTAVPAVFGVPSYPGRKPLINARSETASERKTFSNALQKSRTVLPASGFYEWSRDTKKTKYLFTRDGSSTIYLCGMHFLIDGRLYFVILTEQANESVIGIHDRMPVIIDETEVRPYLTDNEAAAELIRGPGPILTSVEVSSI